MLLVVGRIGRAHGVLGEATIEVRTDVPDERFFVGANLVTDPAERGPLTVLSLRDHNGTLLLKFKEASDRNEIEKLRDTILYSEIDMNEEHQHEDEFHVQQLLDCEVVTQDGFLIGTVTDVINLPGQDVLAVAGENGEVLIPFVIEIVPEIDLEKMRITVIPPPGLLDIANSKDAQKLKDLE